MGSWRSTHRRTRRNCNTRPPIALTQVGQIAMMATDLAWIGHVGTEAVATAALVGMILSVGVTFAAGVISAVVPLPAQACGAADGALVRRSVRMGLWAAILLWEPIMVLPLQGEQIVLALTSKAWRRLIPRAQLMQLNSHFALSRRSNGSCADSLYASRRKPPRRGRPRLTAACRRPDITSARRNGSQKYPHRADAGLGRRTKGGLRGREIHRHLGN
ncbi:hypothetical protein I6F31_04840 [Bradyrhizobium sp. NBAIM01]|nr:hypothetical protein [Bradyrhizobium sp. NBAIM01]